MASAAFQVTADDVECVLHSYSCRLMNTDGLSIVDLSAELIDEIDRERIEKAALNASTDLDEQTEAALKELKANLVELGVLEF